MINYNDEEKDKVVGAQNEQPDNKPQEITKTTTTTKENNSEVAVNNYQMKPFTAEMEAVALKAAEESSAFQSLMNKRNERMGQHGKRAQSAEDAAKALAWTNLFANLAKIAGMGKAPVVKEDTGFMDRAFAEADALRKSYYAKDEEYEDMLNKYKTSYVDAARSAHNKSEVEKYKAEAQRVKDINALARQNTKTTTTTTEQNPYKEAEHQRKEELHPIQKAKIQAQTKAAESKAEGTSGKGADTVVYTYPNPEDGYSYQITRSDARSIKEKLVAIANNTTDNPALKKELDDDIVFLDQTYEYGTQDAALGDLVAKYIGRYPKEFKDVLDRSKRTKTRSNSVAAKPVETKTPAVNPVDVSTLIK